MFFAMFSRTRYLKLITFIMLPFIFEIRILNTKSTQNVCQASAWTRKTPKFDQNNYLTNNFLIVSFIFLCQAIQKGPILREAFLREALRCGASKNNLQKTSYRFIFTHPFNAERKAEKLWIPKFWVFYFDSTPGLPTSRQALLTARPGAGYIVLKRRFGLTLMLKLLLIVEPWF